MGREAPPQRVRAGSRGRRRWGVGRRGRRLCKAVLSHQTRWPQGHASDIAACLSQKTLAGHPTHSPVPAMNRVPQTPPLSPHLGSPSHRRPGVGLMSSLFVTLTPSPHPTLAFTPSQPRQQEESEVYHSPSFIFLQLYHTSCFHGNQLRPSPESMPLLLPSGEVGSREVRVRWWLLGRPGLVRAVFSVHR